MTVETEVTVATMERVAYVFGRSLETVRVWQEQGLPGEPGHYDLAECYRWVRRYGFVFGRARMRQAIYTAVARNWQAS